MIDSCIHSASERLSRYGIQLFR